MSSIDKNKIFFGLLHYIFSEQNNINWAFKTSLVNFTGINNVISNKKYMQEPLTDSIIDYLKDVKPYHVQFEQYIEKYTSQQDEVLADISEIQNLEYYIRYDAVTSTVDEQGSLSDIEYMDTHMANRLYYYKTKDINIIKDYLNCHFKGITVNGGTLNIDKSGYDAYLYDYSLYDAPTVTNEYCLVNFNESLNNPYEKHFIEIGNNSFELLNNEYIIDEIKKSDLEIKSYYNNKIENITDFSFNGNILTIFYNTRKFEKIIVTYKKENINIYSYVFVAHPFIENLNEDSLKKFVSMDTRTFPIPLNNITSGKVMVHIENMYGSRFSVPTNGYEIDGNNIIVYDSNLNENWKVLLTVIDYSYIYDKIYNWEDLYGWANNPTPFDVYYDNYNNIENLEGHQLLRPSYEVERPSELTASQIGTYLMMYDENKNILNIDYKNFQYNIQYENTAKLLQDVNIGDKEILIDNADTLVLPYKKDDILLPGKIIINSEIIGFYDYEILSDNSIKITKLLRACDGSYVCISHKKDDIVYPIPKENKIYENNNKSISYMVYNNESDFKILGETNNVSKINVYKKSNIKLLSDITFDSTYFDISSNDIVLPTDRKDGFLFINDDKIYYKQISKISTNKYRISEFNIDKEYYSNESFILSKTPKLLKKSEYNIVNKNGEVYVHLTTPPSKYEIISINNFN